MTLTFSLSNLLSVRDWFQAHLQIRKEWTLQEREVTKDNIKLIQRLIEANPYQNRTWLSKELCLLWNWRAANCQIKDMACRTLLLKLK